MNSTNRGLNRLFILIVGLLVLAAGAVAILLGTLPAFAGGWRSTAEGLVQNPPAWVEAPVVGRASLLVLGVILLAVILILLLLAFVFRQGHGRSAAALQQHEGATSTRIDLAIPRALLEEHLGRREEIVGLRITAYEVRNSPMLKISARCRRGVSPAVVADLIGHAIDDLEAIVGTDVPAFVQLTGGFRSGRSAGALVA